MREDGADRRIGHIVGRYINGFDRSDAAAARRRNALLQFRHFRKQRRLITDRCRHASEQAGQLAARLNEAERVVHQEQYLLGYMVAQIFCISERREADAKTHTGRLVHLPEHHQRARHDPRILHVMPEFVPLTYPLADPGKNRNALVQANDGVHELHDQHRLADPRAAK